MQTARSAGGEIAEAIGVSIERLALRVGRMMSALTTPLGRRGLRHGVVATLAPQPMLRRLRPTLVLDVGANRGQFALDCVRAVPGVRVISVEPQIAEANVLQWIFRSSPQVQLVTCALGDTSGVAPLHVARARDSSSLLPIGRLQSELFPKTSEETQIDVRVLTFDDAFPDLVIPADALLKVDVQGAELEVLHGLGERLTELRWLYLELSYVELYDGQALAHDVVRFLAEREFFPVDVGPTVRRRGRAVQQDVLFENCAGP